MIFPIVSHANAPAEYSFIYLDLKWLKQFINYAWGTFQIELISCTRSIHGLSMWGTFLAFSALALMHLVYFWTNTIPIHTLIQNVCTSNEKHLYEGALNGTIHVVAGGAGASVSDSEFSGIQTPWSIFRDFDHGFVKLTAFDHSNLLFEYKKSRDGKVYDSFRISRDYRHILACTMDSCPATTLATWLFDGGLLPLWSLIKTSS